MVVEAILEGDERRGDLCQPSIQETSACFHLIIPGYNSFVPLIKFYIIHNVLYLFTVLPKGQIMSISRASGHD